MSEYIKRKKERKRERIRGRRERGRKIMCILQCITRREKSGSNNNHVHVQLVTEYQINYMYCSCISNDS